LAEGGEGLTPACSLQLSDRDRNGAPSEHLAWGREPMRGQWTGSWGRPVERDLLAFHREVKDCPSTTPKNTVRGPSRPGDLPWALQGALERAKVSFGAVCLLVWFW
jgi:hypothetical protein